MLHFLHDLPTEIRSQIYVDLLSSSTGYVALHSSTLEDIGRFSFFEYDSIAKRVQGDPFSLSILRTCRKVYFECAQVSWKQNTLALWQRELFCYGLERTNHRRVFSCVESVYLDLDPMRREELYWTKLSLNELGIWASEGMLKRISLNVTDNWRELGKLMQMRLFGEPRRNYFGIPNQTAGEMLFQTYLEVFREAERDSLANVQRKISLRAGITRWPLEPKEVLERLVGTEEDFRGFLEDLNDSCGGELLVDGVC